MERGGRRGGRAQDQRVDWEEGGLNECKLNYLPNKFNELDECQEGTKGICVRMSGVCVRERERERE